MTGHVVLEGERDVDPEDDDEAFEHARAVACPVSPVQRDDPTHISIRPPNTESKIEWMQAFLQQHGAHHESAVVAELRTAIDADDPAAALSDVLTRNAELRDAWYLYRSDRVHELIDDWLAENDVQPVDRPPWGK